MTVCINKLSAVADEIGEEFMHDSNEERTENYLSFSSAYTFNVAYKKIGV